MIIECQGICDLLKVGLESGKKYSKPDLRLFVTDCLIFSKGIEGIDFFIHKIYFKDSLLKAADIRREELPENCVTRDYDIFKNR
jgi:hypothetical protein